MMLTTEDIVKSTPWGDISLLGIRWAAGGRDVVLHVELGGGQERWVACTWTAGLVVQLSHNDGGGGRPLTWDATFENNDDGTWSAVFDFAHVGEIRLRCNEIRMYTSPPE